MGVDPAEEERAPQVDLNLLTKIAEVEEANETLKKERDMLDREVSEKDDEI